MSQDNSRLNECSKTTAEVVREAIYEAYQAETHVQWPDSFNRMADNVVEALRARD